PVPSRLAKKDRFSEQNTSKTLKNRRLWTGTRLRPVEIRDTRRGSFDPSSLCLSQGFSQTKSLG
ncbi:hypothetical protein, partial [Sinorhizobium meliloti]